MDSVRSFDEFYRRHYPLVLSVAEHRIGSRPDAEDITAEVFRIAWQYHSENNELTLPWVYTVTRNVIGNEYRRTSRVAALVDRVIQHTDPTAAVTHEGPSEEIRQHVKNLREQDRELIYMAYWEDLSRDEIAQILGCTTTTVRVRLLRARRSLEKMIREADETGEAEYDRS